MRKAINIAIVAIVGGILVAYIVLSLVNVQNVFDEMYYAHDKTTAIPWTWTNYRKTHIDRSLEDTVRYEVENSFMEVYQNINFLESSEVIEINGDLVHKRISFACKVVWFSESQDAQKISLWFKYCYNVNNKVLTLEPIYVER